MDSGHQDNGPQEDNCAENEDTQADRRPDREIAFCQRPTKNMELIKLLVFQPKPCTLPLRGSAGNSRLVFLAT